MSDESVLSRLRTATAPDHEALESALGLLAPPLSRDRFVSVLQGFHRFHRAWEPKIAELIGRHDLLAPRARLTAIERDLTVLGAVPEDGPAPDLTALVGPAEGWGSLYVMEGSTLGGLVIAKALRDAAWAPDGGLAYFAGHGRDTGPMWRETCAAIEAAGHDVDPARVVAGARSTFAALQVTAQPAA